MNFIIDLDGKTLKVTDIDGAIKQASIFSMYEHEDHPRTKYWSDILNKLLELKSTIKPIEPIIDTVVDNVPLWVRELRQERLKYGDMYLNRTKYFVKNGERSAKGKQTILYGAHSCVKTRENLNRLDKLEVGETWVRIGQPNLIRIF